MTINNLTIQAQEALQNAMSLATSHGQQAVEPLHILDAIVTEDDLEVTKLADQCISIPQTLAPLAPLLAVIPLQLLAYHIAVEKGLNVDMPRNLAKSVTVE